MTGPRHELLTIGHSNHTLATFIGLLRRHSVEAIADVQSSPFSQYAPQFNRDVLANLLTTNGIRYVFMGEELGARRAERECYVGGKVRFEMVRQLPLFVRGLERLRGELPKDRVAVMCGEKDPITCHRMILVCRGLVLCDHSLRVGHILEDGKIEGHDSAEDRLLALLKMAPVDLFRTKEQVLEEAYERQGQRIAFAEGDADEATDQR
jgi:uncharacterized protein (DUF488 family)